MALNVSDVSKAVAQCLIDSTIFHGSCELVNCALQEFVVMDRRDRLSLNARWLLVMKGKKPSKRIKYAGHLGDDHCNRGNSVVEASRDE